MYATKKIRRNNPTRLMLRKKSKDQKRGPNNRCVTRLMAAASLTVNPRNEKLLTYSHQIPHSSRMRARCLSPISQSANTSNVTTTKSQNRKLSTHVGEVAVMI
ncbi:hypothetical protein ACFL1R_09595 [Candidatus Latescibacterota bacterium]